MTIKWGILGPGTIAHKFARGLDVLPEAELFAVGSRSEERARKFAEKYNFQKSYGSYESLVADPEIDVIYVSTPHTFHKKHSILALEAGKSVLCEKPFAINAHEVKEMINCARENEVFLMEAMWTRFLPVINKVQEWITDGRIGEVRQLRGDFGFRTEINPQARLFNPELGGGALLDVGIYTVSFASLIFGQQPQKIKSMSHKGKTGVDEQTAITFKYDQGQLAQLSCAIRTSTPEEVLITGTEGMIKIPKFWHAKKATLYTEDNQQKVEIPLRASGYNYEAQEVINCLKKGKMESNILPLDESLAIMETMDQIRQQIDLQYPGEK